MRWAPALAPAGVALLPDTAFAHATLAGGGDFVNGLLHPLAVPGHLLTLAAAGLWLGRRELDSAGPVLIVFAASLALGLALSAWAPWPGWHERALLLLALLAGALTALAVPPRRAAGMVLLGPVALLVGLDSPPDGSALSGAAVTLAGTWIGAYLVLLNVAGIVSFARRPWLRVAVRIAGSWVAAIALLVLALSFRG